MVFTHWSRSKKILSSPVNSEVVLLDIDEGNYFGLEDAGARLWNLLEHPRDSQWLLEQLERDYGVSPDLAKADVFELLDQMLQTGLVSKSNNSTPGSQEEPTPGPQGSTSWTGLKVFSVSALQTAGKFADNTDEIGDTIGPS